jgi:hypothetical protein
VQQSELKFSPGRTTSCAQQVPVVTVVAIIETTRQLRGTTTALSDWHYDELLGARLLDVIAK